MRRLLFALAGGLALLVLPGSVLAAPRVEADPNKAYPVTPEAGPWMICAASFRDERAQYLAHQLVYQLRSRDHLSAYFFSKSEEERRQRREEQEQLRRQHPEADLSKIRRPRIRDEYIVLVGGYTDMDAARKALNDIKKLKPPELVLPDGKPGLDMIRQYVPAKNGYQVVEAPVNPFASAFVCRNPSLPQERTTVDPEKLDPFTKELNAGESYSLLKCKKPYTLVVKVFEGNNVLQPRSATSTFLDKLGMGSKTGELLNAGALQAHELARVLRESMNLDAYVLHTRYNSVVTVGGFESENDDQLQQVRRKLPVQIGPVEMLAQPFAWKVPQ